MQKINKRRKKLQLGDKKYIRSFKKRLNQRIRYFGFLRSTGRVKKPYWFKSVMQTNIRNNANDFILNFKPKRVGVKVCLKHHKADQVFDWHVLHPKTFSFSVKPRQLRFGMIRKLRSIGGNKKIFRPNWFNPMGRKFIGPRTLRHWWLHPARWHTFTYLYRLRRGGTHTPMWYPRPKKNSLRSWFYTVKSVFKSIYGITQDKALYKMLWIVLQSKKSNKISFLFEELESRLYIVLIRMGFAGQLKEAIFYIKSGLVFINGKRTRLSNYKVKSGDSIQIRYYFRKLPSRWIFRFRRLEMWSSYRRIKQPRNLHVNYTNLIGVFLETPKLNEKNKSLFLNPTYGFYWLAHFLSQYRNIIK